MTDIALIYRDQLVRAVIGTRPAMQAKEADPRALSRLCDRLVESEEALELARAAGYGQRGESIADVVKRLIAALPPTIERNA